jgi:hypothetical protein
MVGDVVAVQQSTKSAILGKGDLAKYSGYQKDEVRCWA